MPTGIKVKDAMVNRTITIKPNQTAYEAAKIMKKEDVGSLVVVEGKKPVGIVTREDMTNKIAAEDVQSSKIPVKKIMNQPLVTCDQDDDIIVASKLMVKYGYKQLPVVYLNKLVGYVSVREILKIAPTLIETFKERLDKTEIPTPLKETIDSDCELCGNYSEGLENVNGRWVCEACKEEAEEI